MHDKVVPYWVMADIRFIEYIQADIENVIVHAHFQLFVLCPQNNNSIKQIIN